ncbi:5061_t:CDS:2 [Diversispora eburnea]|uniref:5061_t:CDS:1 n=1 Tax=Diversispora eburnea TaxID=1213867 RepID=A0A9N9F244_9GLOM|nr:5061_t:CDS:2 [Diversispora eburnea]
MDKSPTLNPIGILNLDGTFRFIPTIVPLEEGIEIHENKDHRKAWLYLGLSQQLDENSNSLEGGIIAYTDLAYLRNINTYKRNKASDIYSLEKICDSLENTQLKKCFNILSENISISKDPVSNELNDQHQIPYQVHSDQTSSLSLIEWKSEDETPKILQGDAVHEKDLSGSKVFPRKFSQRKVEYLNNRSKGVKDLKFGGKLKGSKNILKFDGLSKAEDQDVI